VTDIHKQALNLIATGDWDGAHTLIQGYKDELSCVIHGFLHRQEGDLSNANYWYNRAGHTLTDNTLEDELQRLVLLEQQY